MANFYTPEFDPPLLPPNPTEEERRLNKNLGIWIQALSRKIDAYMEAYISSTAQMADSLIGLDQRKAFTVLISSTVNLPIGGVTSLAFTYTTAPAKQPMVMPVCTAQGWFATVQFGNTSASGIGLNVINNSTSTAGVTWYVAYL